MISWKCYAIFMIEVDHLERDSNMMCSIQILKPLLRRNPLVCVLLYKCQRVLGRKSGVWFLSCLWEEEGWSISVY